MLHLLISGSKASSHNGWEVTCNKPSEMVHMKKAIGSSWALSSVLYSSGT